MLPHAGMHRQDHTAALHRGPHQVHQPHLSLPLVRLHSCRVAQPDSENGLDPGQRADRPAEEAPSAANSRARCHSSCGCKIQSRSCPCQQLSLSLCSSAPLAALCSRRARGVHKQGQLLAGAAASMLVPAADHRWSA